MAIFYMACSPLGDLDNNESVQEYGFPVFIDNEEITDDSVNVQWFNDGNHNALYFGELTDTIHVKPAFGWMEPPPAPPGGNDTMEIIKGRYSNYFLDWRDSRGYQSAYRDSVQLNITIDTSQYISNASRKAYPVLIENLHSDTVFIGYSIYIPIITEALNKNGEWQPIEERVMYLCGVGLKSIILPPKQYVVTSELVYTGDFKTKLRLKLGTNYSREFVGSINLSQFESQ